MRSPSRICLPHPFRSPGTNEATRADVRATHRLTVSSEVRHLINGLVIDNFQEEELDEMMAEVDPDGQGVIDYKKFVEVIFAPVQV